jgi:N-acyl-D-amino-acid deacylase
VTHTLLRGGVVFDGVSPRGRRTDVRLYGGVVAELGPELAMDGARILDVDGTWVLPGFVDAHSHADAAVLTGHEMERRARSGVTTDVVGQDGMGLPFTSIGDGAVVADLVEAVAGPLPGLFSDVADYLRAVDAGAFARTAVLAPHGTIRAAVTGRSLEPAGRGARAHMRALAQLALEQGACGVSTGLSYPPALASDTDEIVDVLTGVPSGTPYVTHVRSYGAGLHQALREACEIAARTGTSLHLSHLHVSGPGRHGGAGEVVHALLAAAPDATWDSYPYLAGCTFLTAVLPAWAQEHAFTDLLRDERLRERAVVDLDRSGPGPTVATGWDGIVLTGLADGPLSAWDRRDVAAVAAESRTSPGEVVVRAGEQAPRSCVLVPQGHLENVLEIASSPRHMVGSDGIFGSGAPHPRLTSSFLRFLAWAADGTAPFDVADAVVRMTSRPAARFGLPVGVLRRGAAADVVVLDPERLSAGPELESEYPDAVRHVLVAGQPTVRDGAWTGARLSGLALRRRWT